MAMDALVKPLKALPIFQGLEPAQLTEIVRRAERIVYRPGDVIAAENKQADAAIVVIAGSCVRVDDGLGGNPSGHGELVSEGSLIAELAMLVEIIHPSTIVARDQVKALRLTRDRMHALLEEDRSLADHFTSTILRRLKQLGEELTGVEALFSIDDGFAPTLGGPHQPALPAGATV